MRRWFLVVGLFLLVALGDFLTFRFHWNVEIETGQFTESARSLDNPNRGFYYIYGFYIQDEPMDYETLVAQKFEKDTQTSLALIQINLQAYRGGAISEQGLENIDKLFEALCLMDKQYLVRFLYDWDGENEQYEPQKLDIILEHMRQAGPLLQKYASHIFSLQGLFIGNWGEMNGTRYLQQKTLRKLANTLAEVSDPQTYLAVRMPAQWRTITQTARPQQWKDGDSPLYGRLGLFNDGMLGNAGDYGTYGEQSSSEAGTYAPWKRSEEIAFQEVLCRSVPNGGEVIIDNPYNDLKNAIADLQAMHVTYLNRDYDRSVLNKWSRSTVTTNDCFNGVDGLTYVEQHLGYRLQIQQARVSQEFWKDCLHVEIDIQNVGFAPLYKECRAQIVLQNDSGDVVYETEVANDISKLCGGKAAHTRKTETIALDIPMRTLREGKFDIYFSLCDVDSGRMILMANEQDCEALGYWTGRVKM